MFKDYALLTTGQIVSRLLGLLAFAWLARVLDPEGYGVVEYIIGLSTLVATLVDGGPAIVGVRRLAQDPGALSGLAFQIMVTRISLVVIGAPVIALVAFTTLRSAIPAGLVWLFALSVLAAPWRHEWLFQATGRMNCVAAAQMIRAGVFAAIVWALVRSPRALIAVGWAEICAVTALTAYCIYIQHSSISPFRLSGSLRGVSALIKESVAAGSSNFVWSMSQYAPLFMIGALVGGVQTAWFAAAARLIGSLLVFTYVYHFGLYPVVARALARDDGRLSELLQASCRVSAWGGVFVALAITLLAEPLMVVVMGANLAPAASMLQVLAWALPLSICSGHAYWSLAASGAQTRLLWAQLAGVGAVVGVGLLIGPLADGLGYSFAALAGFVMVWVVAHVFAARCGLHPPSPLVLLRPALFSAVILFAAHTLKAELWPSLVGLALYVVAAPLIDRRLLRAVTLFGRAMRDADVARRG